EGNVVVMDTGTGKERLRLKGDHARGGNGVAFSPDGATLVTNVNSPYQQAAGTTLALWDAKSGAFRRTLRLATRYVQGFDFSPDGRMLVTTGPEPVVRLWDVATGREILAQPAHTETIASLAFLPDGTALVSGALDGGVRLWD